VKDSRSIIKSPLVTERGTQLRESQNKYLFKVDKDANKLEIKQAIQDLFKVRVTKVTTQIVPGKMKRLGRFEGRRPDWKKAIVTLAEGDRIELYEGA